MSLIVHKSSHSDLNLKRTNGISYLIQANFFGENVYVQGDCLAATFCLTFLLNSGYETVCTDSDAPFGGNLCWWYCKENLHV